MDPKLEARVAELHADDHDWRAELARDLAAELKARDARVAVATLFDDGTFLWKKGDHAREQYRSQFAGWKMDVFASPPALPDEVRDAARYRWLRDNKHLDDWWSVAGPADRCENIDADIDAALAQEKGGEAMKAAPLSNDEVRNALYTICQRIEKCGASPELTHAVVLASELHSALSYLNDGAWMYAADRVRNVLLDEAPK